MSADLVARARAALDGHSELGEATSSILGTGAVAAVEQRAAAAVGVAHGLALPSATAALRVALLALGVGPGDDVLVPAYDWLAAAAAVRSLGAEPVAVDVVLPHCGIDPDEVRRLVTRRTAAVVASHLFGVPADVPAIRAACDPLGVPVVEDCSQALGARIDGRPVGSLGRVAVVSFGPGKVVDAGGGGALLTDDPELWRLAVRRSQHPARQLLAGVPVPDLGVFESRIHPLAALLAVDELARLPGRVAERRRAAELAAALAARHPALEPPGDLARRACAGSRLPVLVVDPACAADLDLLPPGQHVVAGDAGEPRAPTPRAHAVATRVALLRVGPAGGPAPRARAATSPRDPVAAPVATPPTDEAAGAGA